MRNLKKNQRKLYYAPFMGTESILDEYGNETLEVTPLYGDKTELWVNYSPNTGQLDNQMFGDITNYSRVLTFVGTCPLKEKDHLWINDETYEVVKVADGLNSYLVAIGEIV
ncbi:hypothetical protein [Methanobrevibacter sp.]|uniref:hypothetical protein n=1 Tax=Methanobrevibacter sp. TaxID=66852 RepID=UPI0038910944